MQDKNAAPFFEFEINSDVDSISRIDDDAGEIEGVVPALNRSAKLYLRLGRLMKVKYSCEYKFAHLDITFLMYFTLFFFKKISLSTIFNSYITTSCY